MNAALSEDRSRWLSPSRYPVTLLLVVALVSTALLTGTAAGELPRRLVNRFGFAPADFWAMDLWRLFTSALITQGGAAFFLALVVVALSSGFVELRVGSRWALLAFWGSHIWTLLVMSIALRPALADGSQGLEHAMATLRDVGPSAGYFGCVGVALAIQQNRLVLWAGSAVVAVWLAVDLIGLSATAPSRPGELSADVAHMVAFASAWLVTFAVARTGPRRATEDPVTADR